MELNITGTLLENELDFNFKKLSLQYLLESESFSIKDIRNDSCSVIHLKEREYTLNCIPKQTSFGNIIEAYSDLETANLIVLFKNKENIINIDKDINIGYYYYKKRNTGLKIGIILAIIISCLLILIIIIILIIYNKSRKKEEMNANNTEWRTLIY